MLSDWSLSFDSPAKHAAQEVRVRLLWDILLGHLRPGDQIDIDAVSREMGLSRTPVRDAVISLQTLGLVRTRGRRTSIADSKQHDWSGLLEVWRELFRLVLQEGIEDAFGATNEADQQLMVVGEVYVMLVQHIQYSDNATLREAALMALLRLRLLASDALVDTVVLKETSRDYCQALLVRDYTGALHHAERLLEASRGNDQQELAPALSAAHLPPRPPATP